MTEIEQYFPLGIATGMAFLGRETETHQLKANLQQHRHTLLLAPRQYGKSSLARFVLQDATSIWVGIDLFLGLTETTIVNCFVQGLNRFIASISSSSEQILLILREFFTHANKKWKLGFGGVSLEIEPERNNSAAHIILEGLQAIDHLLKKKKQKGVFFIDEFQEISKLPTGREIEGAIRHFAQESNQITFIFSGSNRHLLQNIFSDSQRPLYELCDWMVIHRLTKEVYQAYLEKIAKKILDQTLTPEAFEEIIELAELHPRRTYALCGRVWSRCLRDNTLLSPEIIKEEWDRCVHERTKAIRQELGQLSAGQLKLLIAIALECSEKITSKSIQHLTDLASSSIVHNLTVLEEKDFIERRTGDTFQIIDPLIKTTLQIYYADGI